MFQIKTATVKGINFKGIVRGEYSADVLLEDHADRMIFVRLSGNKQEAHKPFIPGSEYIFVDEKVQDWAVEFIDLDDLKEALDNNDIENNFNFLQENEWGLM